MKALKNLDFIFETMEKKYEEELAKGEYEKMTDE